MLMSLRMQSVVQNLRLLISSANLVVAKERNFAIFRCSYIFLDFFRVELIK